MKPVGDDLGRLAVRGPAAISSLTFFSLLLLAFAGQVLLVPGVVSIPPGIAFVPGALFGGVELAAAGPVIPPPATLVTCLFLQASWLQLLGNLLFLWSCGPKVELTLGPGRWTVLLLACGMADALAQAWLDPASPAPLVGASGSISGLLGACLILQPRAKICLGVPGMAAPVVQLPVLAVIVAWLLLQFLGSNWTGMWLGEIALRARVGGFVCGLLLAPMLHSTVLLSADARAVARTLRSRDSSH